MKKINLYGVLLAGGLLLLSVWLSFLMEPIIVGQPYNESTLVNTTVNITNAAPFIYDVKIPPSINLIAYDNLTVLCNFTVYDYDNNTVGANATLHLSTVSSDSAPDHNTLYSNSSCTPMAPIDFITNYTCAFTVRYYANNGTWFCNATAFDNLNASNSNISNPGIVNPLIAIKTDLLLDFGQFGVGEQSNDSLANITNAGNRNINISVRGYGVTDGDNLAMTCTNGNIPVGYEHYDIWAESDYSFMAALTGSDVLIQNFFVPQRLSDIYDSVNTTYWKLEIPSGAGGTCNGKVVFTASDRGA
jgi:hypothetical protein